MSQPKTEMESMEAAADFRDKLEKAQILRVVARDLARQAVDLDAKQRMVARAQDKEQMKLEEMNP
jgi:hypothetical protein